MSNYFDGVKLAGIFYSYIYCFVNCFYNYFPYITIKKKNTAQLDIFSAPLETRVSNFSVAKEIKATISNHGGLIIDDIGLNENHSRKILGEKFDQIILGVMNNEQLYEEYFPFKDIIIAHLHLKFPHAKSSLLVFETLYHHARGATDIPLCFDRYGTLDPLAMYRKFTYGEVQKFFDRIIDGERSLQQYTILQNELLTYLQYKHPLLSPDVEPKKINLTLSKKTRQEERRLLDDSFPLPQQIPGLPYIHIENNTLALKYMIGLYTSGKVKDILEQIDQEIFPYTLPWLKDMLDSLIASARIHSYDYLISSLCTNIDVIKTREWKGRLTMRLKSLLNERKLPDIKYDDGIIRYIPTGIGNNNNTVGMISYSMGIGYNKDVLFNLRPDQWQTELFRRIAERKTYAEFMDPLDLFIRDLSLPGVSLAKHKESVCIERAGIRVYHSISDMLHMPQEQREPAIRKRIDELPDISQQRDVQSPNEASVHQDIVEVPNSELAQQLSTLLDECLIFPDDGIDALQRHTSEFLRLGIGVLWEPKEIVDIATGSIISFETLCKDGHEFLKIAILEWFTENRDNTQPIPQSPDTTINEDYFPF